MSKKNLSPQQVKVIELLLAGSSITMAAVAADISRSAITKWMATDSLFIAELREGQQALIQSATGYLLAQLDEAISGIIRLASGAEDENVRLKANIALIDRLLALRNQTDIEPRVTRLENTLTQQAPNN
ncbi:MAG: hypothetical protein KIH69_003115 [Anaerolineae bacterium]|nr:hypothetical protein [Anaerolineae bacterium]